MRIFLGPMFEREFKSNQLCALSSIDPNMRSLLHHHRSVHHLHQNRSHDEDRKDLHVLVAVVGLRPIRDVRRSRHHEPPSCWVIAVGRQNS
jgi:hypothetical protein